MHTIELLLWDLPRCSQLLEIAPVFKTHQGSWDKVRLLHEWSWRAVLRRIRRIRIMLPDPKFFPRKTRIKIKRKLL